MGGFGSGLWQTFKRKLTVEESVVLDSAWMAREQAFDPDGIPLAAMVWRDGRTDDALATVEYRVRTRERLLWLTHAALDEIETQTYALRLSTTDLSWGGKRWWFHCPLVRDNVACDARAAKLYLPPGARYFACRKCYDLTYESCQDSHRFDRLWRMSGEERGMTSCDMKAFLQDQQLSRDLEQRQRRNAQRRERRSALGWK